MRVLLWRAFAFCVALFFEARPCSAMETLVTTAAHGATSLLTAEPTSRPSPTKSIINSTTVSTVSGLGLRSFKSEEIFRNGDYTAKWKRCGHDGVQFKHCRVFGLYEDRVTIKYTYDSNRASEYLFSPPSVTPLTTAAAPTIGEHEALDGAFQFTLFFNCQRVEHANSTGVFDLQIPILRDFTVETRFTKRCSSGVHPHARLVVVRRAQEEVLTRNSSIVRVPPSVITTDMLLRVTSPATNIVHGAPKLSLSREGVEVKLRGISKSANVIVGSDLKFWIMYECMAGTETDVSLSIPIPPWDDLTANLTKTCSASAPETLQVGTKAGMSDVVRGGEISPEFNLTNALGYTKGAQNFVIGKDTTQLALYVQNSESRGRGALHFGGLGVTVSDRAIARAARMQSKRSELGVLKPGESRAEVVRFTCLQQGEAKVVISLPVLQYKAVEFCVTKRCRQPLSFRKGAWESVWTVGGVEEIVFAVLAVALAVGYLGRRGQLRLLGSYSRLRGYVRPATR